ncbi:MAG: hypothetical protein F6J96_35935 [Symploca sp. SIO1C2]|nr:hypothetical protein [Symploca sp. SIO1C2]
MTVSVLKLMALPDTIKYICTGARCEFNNLLQAGILAINASEEKIKNISRYVPKSRFLAPNELSVYSLSDGYCQSILDAETGLIDTNIIDEVSNELAIQFDQLLDIES